MEEANILKMLEDFKSEQLKLRQELDAYKCLTDEKICTLEGKYMLLENKLNTIESAINNVNTNTNRLVDKLLDNVIDENKDYRGDKIETRRWYQNLTVQLFGAGGLGFIIISAILKFFGF